MKLAVILLTCGQLRLTNDVVADIAREADDGIDLYVIDNDSEAHTGYVRQWRETIIKPNTNLRWVKGVNLGIKIARSLHDYDGIICLNDDIRLSLGFFGAMRAALSDPYVGLVAPSYDDVYRHQRADYSGPAGAFSGVPRRDLVNFVDGTAFGMRTEVIDEVGLLDEIHFGQYGWGSDLDYSYRMRDYTYNVVVTHEAFINHFHQGSAKFVEPDWSGKAGVEMVTGMTAKYGQSWQSLTGYDKI